MIRVYLVLAVVSVAVLVLMRGLEGKAASAVRWIAAAYLLAAAALLVFGVGL